MTIWHFTREGQCNVRFLFCCTISSTELASVTPYLWITWFSFHHLIELNIVTSLSSHLVRISGRLNKCMQEKILNHMLIVAWCSNSICQCFVIMKIASIYFTFFYRTVTPRLAAASFDVVNDVSGYWSHYLDPELDFWTIALDRIGFGSAAIGELAGSL